MFDKTGTLTEGRPKVDRCFALGRNGAATTYCALAASLERLSEHPLAQADRSRRGEQRTLQLADGRAISRTSPARASRPASAMRNVLVGNTRLMQEEGVADRKPYRRSKRIRHAAETVILVARNRELVGMHRRSRHGEERRQAGDRATARRRHRDRDDHRRQPKTAEAIAGQIGIDEVFAEVLPQDKAGQVRRFKAKGSASPLSATASTMRRPWRRRISASPSARALISRSKPATSCWSRGSPLKIIEALKLSRITFRTIKQNLFWAFFYNIAAIPLAAFGLPQPDDCRGGNGVSSVTVVGNSLRIRRQKAGV